MQTYTILPKQGIEGRLKLFIPIPCYYPSYNQYYFNFAPVEPINKVANKNIVLFDAEQYYPAQDEILYFDIKPFLFKELILKEQDFRDAMETLNWEQYRSKHVVVFCSNAAIIPVWAFMIIAGKLKQVDALIYGDAKNIEEAVLKNKLAAVDYTQYQDERIVIKGCSKHPLSESIYMYMVSLFQPYAKAISFGEACSTVPIYRP